MKIRILANTLRFRLRQPEVQLFQEKGKVIEVTEFGPNLQDQLQFCLEKTEHPQFTISFTNNITTIGVPVTLAEEWTNSDLIGFNAKIDTGKGKVIEILVEKDFVCLDDPLDNNIGAYPNPKAIC